MTIGIDVSALQTGHRMRGIGATVLNFINHISENDRTKHRFVFYMLKEEGSSTLELLDLKDMNYEVRFIESRPVQHQPSGGSIFLFRLKKLMGSSLRQLGELMSRYRGDSRFPAASELDVFLQPDQSQPLPRGKHIKKVLMLYDIIPYVLEWDYLWSYNTARLHGLPRLASLRCSARRGLYVKKLKISTRYADFLLAISEHTKKDFERCVGVRSGKIKVTHLGISSPINTKAPVSYNRYIETSWGYSPRPYKLEIDAPFLLYVGGADQRRRLDHLATAYNHLRAQGKNIRLVLVGDTLQGAKNIPTLQIQNSLQASSYLDEIIFMGYVPDEVRESLYKKALALVYPSMYEGFGLPILEAMAYGTPVITYKNSSIDEVAGTSALYVDSPLAIVDTVDKLINDPGLRKKYSALGRNRAKNFSWEKTSNRILGIITT